MKDDDIGREHQEAVASVLARIEEALGWHSDCFTVDCNVREDITELVEIIKKENDA